MAWRRTLGYHFRYFLYEFTHGVELVVVAANLPEFIGSGQGISHVADMAWQGRAGQGTYNIDASCRICTGAQTEPAGYRACWSGGIGCAARYDIMKWLSGSNASAIACVHAGSWVFLTPLVEVRHSTAQHSTAHYKQKPGTRSR
jgi:hypothetical protein